MTQGNKSEPQDRAWIDTMLDDLANGPVPDATPDLMARILADADALLPPPGGAVKLPWWLRVVQGLGGWPAIGGLVAATVTGFVVGLGALDTAGFDDVWTLNYDADYDSESALDAFGWDFEEG